MDKNDYLFGQYLLRFSKYKLDPVVLEKALSIQKDENKIYSSHRRIGTILFEDFQIFQDIDSLIVELQKFENFKREYLQ